MNILIEQNSFPQQGRHQKLRHKEETKLFFGRFIDANQRSRLWFDRKEKQTFNHGTRCYQTAGRRNQRANSSRNAGHDYNSFVSVGSRLQGTTVLAKKRQGVVYPLRSILQHTHATDYTGLN
ncbi:hypothetical protein PoB_002134600 [Plakobranchus ocellatus]|uniref:Uncharacterized protein n=1 Tax=Plakobranchus ocellatus TaxID=259542 RepID=A0AAV3ZJQ3_9GAST|nr:hypothetical protein PoB_002134600 [Plakobranchus ocellatus]